MIEVAFTNDSTVLQDGQITNVLPTLQKQVSEQFAPVWGIDASLKFYTKGSPVPASSWRLSIADTSDQAGALGYHLTTSGIPFGFAFVKSDMQAGAAWTTTLDHELLEMLADPFVMCVVDIPSQQGWQHGGTLLAQEVSDAPEADQFASTMPGADGSNVLLSDWVTPAWFGAQAPAAGYPGCKGAFDFGGHITQAFQILTGGYIGVRRYRGAGSWSTVQGRQAEERPFIMKHDGSRMGAHEIPAFSRRHRRLLNMDSSQKGPDPFAGSVRAVPMPADLL